MFFTSAFFSEFFISFLSNSGDYVALLVNSKHIFIPLRLSVFVKGYV